MNKGTVKSRYPYQTPEVRDLAWACFAPALLRCEQLADEGQNVANCGLALTPSRRDWLARLDREPTALQSHLAARPGRRLGIYFEQLWHFYLQQDPEVELLAHNLPVRHAGRTLGEFDCLYFCHQRQRHIHLELAVKYYLSHRRGTSAAPYSHWEEWLGPNTRDRLDRKLAQLMQRQIRLGERPEARGQLRQLGITDLLQEVEIKGYLFQGCADPLPPPFAFNRDGQLQQWTGLDRLAPLLARSPCPAFVPLDRCRWLAPALATDHRETYSGEELVELLQRQFSEDSSGVLVAGLDQTGQERERLFVTAPLWPA